MEDCAPIGTVADANEAAEAEDATGDEPEEHEGGGTGGQGSWATRTTPAGRTDLSSQVSAAAPEGLIVRQLH
jgi:hypothetical protein